MKIKASQIIKKLDKETSEKLSKAIRIHSTVFKQIIALKEKDKIKKAIRTITHEKPLLVFWVTPEGQVLDAGEAHRDNPPNKDKSIFTDATNKGHLRGRAALIGDKIYIVIYLNDGEIDLTQKQMFILRRTYLKILQILNKKHSTLKKQIEDANFITEIGNDILV